MIPPIYNLQVIWKASKEECDSRNFLFEVAHKKGIITITRKERNYLELHSYYHCLIAKPKQISFKAFRFVVALISANMVDAILEIVVQNLNTFLQEELATFWGVNSQIQKLSSNLTAIRAVLQDAEEKQITSHAVKDWLQKLSDAAYVLDDILEECSIQSNRLQHKEGHPGPHNTCLTRFSPKKILLRRDVGKRMKEITERFRCIDEERRMFELRERFTERQQEDNEWRQTTSVITEHKVYGRDHDKEKIVEFLLSHASQSEELSIYPIVGIGGLGKTTLAQFVFNDSRVNEHFDLKIWVCVSDDYTVERILRSIIESAAIPLNPNLSALESLQKRVQEALQSRRFLLVLDDVWNKNHVDWEKLKLLLQSGAGAKGSSVLVTTRLESVASIMATCPTHHLSPLSEDDIWALFKHHAFGPNMEERAELVAIGMEIVEKCAGLPLASKVLGSLLRNKTEEKHWLNIKESKFWDIPEGEGDAIMRALRLSYFNLKLSSRRCFSFCAIFPEDFRISKEQLIHLWMANDFIKSRGNMEVEDVGNEMWDELCQRSFFQEVEIDLWGNTTFKMHDLFLELARSIMGEECKVFKSASLTNLSSSVHHISFSSFDQPLNFNTGAFKKVESLRTLIVFYPQSNNLHGFPPFNSIRALQTSFSQLSSLKNLTHLRYLNIYSSDITVLPECVSRLPKLQTLKLERCRYLSCLPEHLTQLKDLRHIHIQDCPSLVAMPPKIGELQCLKTLSVFIVDSTDGCGLEELRDLQLGGKLHIKGLENVLSEQDAVNANLVNKKDLNNLCLSWDRNADSKCSNVESILEALKPHSNLKSFGIKGYKGTVFPSWMKSTSILSCLVRIILYDCQNCDQLPPLGKLPHLKELYVSGMEHVKYIDEDSYDGVEERAFKSLKKLVLQRLPNFEKILRDERVEMLPLVVELIISGVPKLKLPLLPSVEILTVGGYDGSNEEIATFLEAILQNMQHVKSLVLSEFPKLKVFSHELGSLISLEFLGFINCDELESLSENVLQGLSSLWSLIFIGCKKLKSLSEGVGHLTCLECIDIHHCPELVTLPVNFNQLTALRRCALSHGIIPEGLQRIPSLQSLSLWNVDSLPEWLGDMASLQKLEIQYCVDLRSLPSSIRNLTNLHTLRIRECPKLEKRCKRGTGQDWQYIARIPDVEVIPSPLQENTFCDKIKFKWNTGGKIKKDIFLDEFDVMADELWLKLS